ncbi:adenylyltransferase/sulfurtransferase [Isoptericola sp. CG 20/1183]|uniref:Adenylyltransferase/sulfurtransferase n=1 Tax=Isoptericola halotolerans TaxID=300560 RepID=A0ABX5EGQ3_9MICO|nr:MULTISPECIES: ThiF family adenylyltransferase [Isoptericola]PRZ06972.1 adenylyltransferase/sulfurtransferase [Isoptericola halotolerans]PRZ07356.1 adenylyltransferase/sulfurtransferase [Isoptericola sp. CG 20/1183]
MRSALPTAPSLPPLVAPGPELTVEQVGRFARHLSLPGIGVEGQRRLAAARVLVVGAGGLGSPALLYLAAAGVGTLGVVDDDVVDASNLQRQVLHGTADVGRAKTASARDAVADVAPAVTVVEHRERLTAANALEVLRGYDLVLDGADNFATRYLVSDAAEIAGVPVVWGGLYRYQGQVATFWAAPPAGADGEPQGVTYRDVFPEPPPAALAPDCATGGVLGALCGTVGSVMATEAIKLITGAGRTLLGRLAVYDALDLTWRHLDVRPDPSREPVTALPDDAAYATFCGLGPVGPATMEDESVSPAAVAALRAAAAEGDGVEPYVLDVREPWEVELAAVAGADLVGLGELLGPDRDGAVLRVAERAQGRPVHVLCKMGGRAAQAAAVLREEGLPARVIAGGILAWSRDVDPSVPAY